MKVHMQIINKIIITLHGNEKKKKSEKDNITTINEECEFIFYRHKIRS